MHLIIQQGLLKARRLTKRQLGQIETLVSACRNHEGLVGTLHLEPPRSLPGGETNQFLTYQDGALIGIVTLPPDDNVELLGLVHPDHRRRGIGRALFEAARAECRRRGAQTFLLVCEDASPAGQAFAEAMGGHYRFAEYSMELDPAAFTPSPPRGKAIAIRRAGEADQDTLIRLASASFDEPEKRRRTQVTAWLGEPNEHLYIAQLGGRAIGVLRATFMHEAIYLHTLQIRSEFRRRGFGRQLLENIVRDLLAEGKSVRLEVDTENDIALSLYRSSGFQVITTYRYYELRA